MRILVTGGAGLIGSHLCDALLARKHEVVSIDNLSKGSLDNHLVARDYKSFRFIKGDVCDRTFLWSYKDGIDVLVHLAAFKIPRYGNRIDTLTVNSAGSDYAFELAARNKAKLVFASTSDVYGKNEKAPLTEEDAIILPGPEVARWSYAVSKVFEEHLGYAYAEKHKIPVVCMRFFATFGDRQHMSWWGGPAPVFIEKAHKQEPITIHGDGLQTRSFSYVSDTVDGIVRCVEETKANNHVFNIGSPRETTVLDFAKMVQEMVNPGKPPKLEFVPYSTFGKYEDVRRRVPDIRKIQELLGFAPKVSVADGLRKTVEWQLAQYAAGKRSES